ncbi:MAG: hypothetical protein NTU90_08985 [Proteobacteria bacterium]|nr:hypothetical protein [Pseudomonadota bacterium]
MRGGKNFFLRFQLLPSLKKYSNRINRETLQLFPPSFKVWRKDKKPTPGKKGQMLSLDWSPHRWDETSLHHRETLKNEDLDGFLSVYQKVLTFS